MWPFDTLVQEKTQTEALVNFPPDGAPHYHSSIYQNREVLRCSVRIGLQEGECVAAAPWRPLGLNNTAVLFCHDFLLLEYKPVFAIKRPRLCNKGQ